MSGRNPYTVGQGTTINIQHELAQLKGKKKDKK